MMYMYVKIKHKNFFSDDFWGYADKNFRQT